MAKTMKCHAFETRE